MAQRQGALFILGSSGCEVNFYRFTEPTFIFTQRRIRRRKPDSAGTQPLLGRSQSDPDSNVEGLLAHCVLHSALLAAIHRLARLFAAIHDIRRPA
jgi:hypothetical protein